MTWWGALLWFGTMLVVNVVVQVWVQRVKRRRSLRSGRVGVSARSTTRRPGASTPRWRTCRVTSEDGRLLLRRASDHPTEPGVELRGTAGPGRPVRKGEVLRMVIGADRVVPFHSSAGLVELAAPAEVMTWLEVRVTPANTA